MQSKEFRRGNLIEYKGCVYEIDIIADVFPHLNTDLFGTGVVGWNDIKGVEIDEKWLEKLGFEFRNERVYSIGHFEVHIVNRTFFVRSFFLRSFKYVHQLQNIYFALTFEELEMKHESKP